MSESAGLTINGENKKLAARQFEYAHRAIAAANNDLAIQMLKMSCKLDPTHLSYRQKLRKVEKGRYKENKRGSLFAHFFCFFKRLAMWRSFQKKKYYTVLDQGEAILAWNPWNREVILCMAEAASLLNHSVIAIWLLQDIRQDIPNDIQINRLLAQLLEREGYFTQAMHLWELIGKELPNDREAVEKARQMAVSETISRGNYGEKADLDSMTGPDSESSSVFKKTGKSSAGQVALGSAASEEINLREAIESCPDDEKTYLQLAKFLRRSGKLEPAREVLHQGLERLPGSVEITLAAIDYQIESYRGELTSLEQKRQRHPKDESIQQAQRRLSRKITRGEKLWLSKKMEAEPNDQGLRYELGLRHVTLGEMDEAISCFQAVRKDPRYQNRCLSLSKSVLR